MVSGLNELCPKTSVEHKEAKNNMKKRRQDEGAGAGPPYMGEHPIKTPKQAVSRVIFRFQSRS